MTALNTEPIAAPLTVPMSPKNDPSTALVAAAPAPAASLGIVRSRAGRPAGATAVTGPVADAPIARAGCPVVRAEGCAVVGPVAPGPGAGARPGPYPPPCPGTWPYPPTPCPGPDPYPP